MIASSHKRSGPKSFFSGVGFLKVVAGGDLVGELRLGSLKVSVEKRDDVGEAGFDVGMVSGNVEVKKGQEILRIFDCDLGNVNFEEISSSLV